MDSLFKLGTVQADVVSRVSDLKKTKTDLEQNKLATEKDKADLIALNAELNNQRALVQSTQADKNQLLSETKQSESEYKQMVLDRQAEKDALEQEILQYEAQMKVNIDISSLPKTGIGVLSWPLDQIKITQYFGWTDYATANPQVYKGTGHNGIDLRASIGTPVKAAMDGVVSGIGNTDLFRGCYSFGKWVMVKHANGLSTLYAHLSLPLVSLGQALTTGELLGYSGNTGFTTGPHLHFGVYATAGLEMKPMTNSRNCNGALIPVASFNAYLNPLSYLPAVP
jgi:murein DD-endopeptidase MepM/ murein hydrolase activator NlpD